METMTTMIETPARTQIYGWCNTGSSQPGTLTSSPAGGPEHRERITVEQTSKMPDALAGKG